MVHQEDTICAIVTPQGIGGISVIRLSGRDALDIASRLFHQKSGKSLSKAQTHTLHYGDIIDPASGEKRDEVLASLMRSPHSFTCEDVVEVSCHGGPLVTSRILEAFIKEGARLAEPGEFTKRAFLNGRIDLAQAEAVIEIIRARTEEGLRCALWQLEGKLSNEINMLHSEIVGAIGLLEAYIDFPEEELGGAADDLSDRVQSVVNRIDRLIEGYYRWRPFREGIVTTIVGRTNVGKSSLLNVLTGEERAIVTPHPGTTRDIIDGMITLSGIPLRLLDTAGLRMAKDLAEEEGIRRMYHTVEMAELILLILDGSEALTEEDREIMGRTTGRQRVIVINKIDRGVRITKDLTAQNDPVVRISALKGEGIEALKKPIRQSSVGQEMKWEGGATAGNLRHKTALEGARKEL
ncbi:MAG: tRNA uridine-5-carboxymethylaminomethyl(34) synthesis GTPase MnmE, partial [Nitrospirota bacterium]|nr:tRNA uridine-5-carboxymethylaminomethyl(34) synthesis GTPase MnmE [Nitrospirota bacterium]